MLKSFDRIRAMDEKQRLFTNERWRNWKWSLNKKAVGGPIINKLLKCWGNETQGRRHIVFDCTPTGGVVWNEDKVELPWRRHDRPQLCRTRNAFSLQNVFVLSKKHS